MSTTDRDQANLPIALRERVMAASLLARGVGETVPAVPPISADEAFERAADAFYRLLGTLSEQGWKTAALPFPRTLSAPPYTLGASWSNTSARAWSSPAANRAASRASLPSISRTLACDARGRQCPIVIKPAPGRSRHS